MKIIAELCQNHNGSPKILKEMIKKASASGATHVKIQHIYSKCLSKRPIFENGIKINKKIVAIKRPYLKEFIRLKKLELDKKNIKVFINICKKYNVIPLTTCFTRGHVKELKKLGFREIKVASYDCASYQLLRDLKKNKYNHIYLSTGASYNQEILFSSKILKNNFSLLHCITEYPTKINRINLSRMQFLKKYCKNVGYSDHTSPMKDGINASLVSIFLGAKVLERHFTILNKDQTRDGPVSVNPSELKEISKFSKLTKKEQGKKLKQMKINIRELIGKRNPKMSQLEILNRDYYRGRFVTYANDKRGRLSIYNWEETPI